MQNELTVKKEIRLNAPAERVWQALTDPEQTKKYMFGCKVLSDWKIGSSLTWEGVSAEGKKTVFVKGSVVDIDDGKLLKFTTFDPNSGFEDIPSNYTTVTCQLTKSGESTLLSVEQGDFAHITEGNKRYEETAKGWDFALAGLRDLVEQRP